MTTWRLTGPTPDKESDFSGDYGDLRIHDTSCSKSEQKLCKKVRRKAELGIGQVCGFGEAGLVVAVGVGHGLSQYCLRIPSAWFSF